MRFFQKIRVPVGSAFGVLCLYFSHPFPSLFYPGMVLVGLGLGIRVWASGHLEKSLKLATGGPYRWTRNPLYFGSFLVGLGFSLAGCQTWLVLLLIVLFITIYVPVMRREEEELLAFGSDYESYRHTVPFFVPRFGKSNAACPQSEPDRYSDFQWRRIILNHEYRAAAGCLILAVMVFLKMQGV